MSLDPSGVHCHAKIYMIVRLARVDFGRKDRVTNHSNTQINVSVDMFLEDDRRKPHCVKVREFIGS